MLNALMNGFAWMLRACLDEESFEWYHLVFCFHHPNCVGPTAQHLFGLVLNHGSHHSKLSKMDDEWPKLKTGFTCFQNSKTEFQWQVGKLDEIVVPFTSALSHLEQAKSYYCWSFSSHFHFPLHPQRASSTIEPNNPKPSNPKSAKHRPSNPKSTKHRPSNPKPNQFHQYNQPNHNQPPPIAATITSPPQLKLK